MMRLLLLLVTTTATTDMSTTTLHRYAEALRGHHVPDMSAHLAQMGNHSACLLHLTQWHEHRQWHKLAHVLAHASRPAVMVLASCAQLVLLHNFLCSVKNLPAHDALLRHVVIWSADACTDDFVLRHWPEIAGSMVNASTWFATAQRADAPFKSAQYAAYATLKAFMPLAAATLGFTALTQDVDIVWRRNAIEYLANISTGRETLMMVEAGQRYKKVKSCFDNLGPGLIYTQPTRESRQILGAWFDQCPEMETRRANAPFFQSAARNLSSCGYDGQESTGSKPHILIFQPTHMVCGQRVDSGGHIIKDIQLDNPSSWKINLSRSAVTVHANHNSGGWAAKCAFLKANGVLYLRAASGDPCQTCHLQFCKCRELGGA